MTGGRAGGLRRRVPVVACNYTNACSASPTRQALYDDGYPSLYNLMFTSLPVMFFAVLDRDLEVRHSPSLLN